MNGSITLISYLIVYIIQGIIFGVATNKIIENKGYYDNWFWWGFFFGIIALLVAMSKPQKLSYEEETYISQITKEKNNENILSEGGWKCAFCYKINPNYVTSCSCGKNKDDTERHNRQVAIDRENLVKKKESVNRTVDPYEEVKKAKELLDMGIISQEEFDKKKTDILGL